MGAGPACCVLVEDTPSGVTAAVSAGMRRHRLCGRKGKCQVAALGGTAVDSVAVKAGLHAGSWAAACTVAAEGLPGLSSPDAQWGGRRDRQLAGRANRQMGASAMASLATGSRSMDPASDQADGGAAATLTLPGRSRLSRARRHHPYAAHPHVVVKPFRSISL
jgi:hypothetical protein